MRTQMVTTGASCCKPPPPQLGMENQSLIARVALHKKAAATPLHMALVACDPDDYSVIAHICAPHLVPPEQISGVTRLITDEPFLLAQMTAAADEFTQCRVRCGGPNDKSKMAHLKAVDIDDIIRVVQCTEANSHKLLADAVGMSKKMDELCRRIDRGGSMSKHTSTENAGIEMEAHNVLKMPILGAEVMAQWLPSLATG